MLKQISTSDAAVGMYVHRMDGNWITHPFWRPRFLLRTERQVGKLRASAVPSITIDLSRGCDIIAPDPAVVLAPVPPIAVAPEIPAPDAPPPEQPAAPARKSREEARRARLLDRAAGEPVVSVRRQAPALSALGGITGEMGMAADVTNRSRQAMRHLFDEARFGKTMDVAAVEPLVDDIMHSIHRHPHAFNGMVRLMKTSNYLHTHALAVSSLMINLATQIGLPQHQVREAGLAGLLMDIGMGHVPADIYDREGELTPAEQGIMQNHTVLAHDFMTIDGTMPLAVAQACLHHHERYDGSGYPHGLAGEEIPLPARMAAICDVYDAMTSHRPHRPGMDPAAVIEHMRAQSHRLDPQLFDAFVRAIGIYPMGSLVRLASNRLAVVLDQNPKNPTLPRVRTFWSTTQRALIEPEDIDLVYRIGKDDILSRERPDTWGIPHWEQMCDLLLGEAFGIAVK